MVEIFEIVEVRVQYTPVLRSWAYSRRGIRRSFRADLFIKAERVGDHTEVTLVTSGCTAMGRTNSPIYTIKCKDDPEEILEAAMKGHKRYWDLRLA